MKLNLLPTYVSREKSAKRAWILMALITLAAGSAAVMMQKTSLSHLEGARTQANEVKPMADSVATTSKKADEIIALAAPFVKNTALARAMDGHNKVYPDFYDQIRKFIPDYFRIYAINLTPIDDKTVAIALNGVIKSQEQYNNLVLALLKIPGVGTVQRSQIPSDDEVVTNLGPGEKTGKRHKLSEPPPSDDPIERLNLKIGEGRVSSYLNVGDFGSGNPTFRGAMPEWHVVTVNFTVPGNLQGPDVRATLGSTGGLALAGAAGGAGAAPARGGGGGQGGRGGG
ncbi:MAG: hypothetical protein HYR64_00055 [Fimbriimonas ginsengisoli]|uniref:PilN domain-containing protein n=1 Tax=Fimbriimonas ginsengisoli TaxID=1005039 RepID=A0A931LQ94_FIMGI|nr:hypothetical protein [Fimbriimonas ginsengisoli]